jgi:preprotein translocase subunit SecG
MPTENMFILLLFLVVTVPVLISVLVLLTRTAGDQHEDEVGD